jgi:hypothetical protein
LKVSKLLNLMEKYMCADWDKPVIHHIHCKDEQQAGTHKQAGHVQDKSEDSNQQYVDIQCPRCQTHSHLQSQCDRMAIWLHLKECAWLVDDKLCKTLLANYANILILDVVRKRWPNFVVLSTNCTKLVNIN